MVETTSRLLMFDAIGTRWRIQLDEAMSEPQWRELRRSIRSRIAEFDAAYSRFRPDSLVARMSRSACTYSLPPDGYALLQCYRKLYELTDGKVTPLIGQTMEDAGYDAAYSLVPKKMQKPPRWEDVLAYDHQSITLNQPVLLDFGAAGKGYLVDIVAQLIEEAGCRSFVIDAGGDIVQRSAAGTDLQVGLENPFDTTEAIGTLRLNNMSLCASSGSKRNWSGMHHIIDPHNLSSPKEVVATWVLADTALIADGLATALFFVPPSHLATAYSFSYAVVMQDGSIHHSKNFPVELF